MKSYIQQLKENISKNLLNSKFEIQKRSDTELLFSNKQLMFEQYRLLIDSAHKIEERRSASNNIFLGVNTLLSSFMVSPYQLLKAELKDLSMLISLTLVGMFICFDWIKVTASYKINYINFLLIKSFEELLPSKVFSLRAELEQIKPEFKVQEHDKANIILAKENTLQKLFAYFYVVYFGTLIYRIINIFI